MTGGSGIKKYVSQEQLTDAIKKLSASITATATTNAANIKTRLALLQDSLNSSTAKNDAQFDQLWEKIGDQAEQNVHVTETVQKIDTFFTDKYLPKKDVKSICFTPFSGEGSEDVATHISRFQSECGPYGNDPLLKLRVFGSSLAGSALTWYTKLVPGSIPDWATMERMFRTTFGTVEPGSTFLL
ncbi:hypothetical protein ACLB2K_015471 [Fragaria x ananassa]